MNFLALLLAFTSFAAGGCVAGYPDPRCTDKPKWEHVNGQWCPENGKEICGLGTHKNRLPTAPKTVCFGFAGKQCDASFGISDDPRKNCRIFEAMMAEFSGHRAIRVETSPGTIWMDCSDPVGLGENWVRKWDTR